MDFYCRKFIYTWCGKEMYEPIKSFVLFKLGLFNVFITFFNQSNKLVKECLKHF